jgi:hypothetical protein
LPVLCLLHKGIWGIKGPRRIARKDKRTGHSIATIAFGIAAPSMHREPTSGVKSLSMFPEGMSGALALLPFTLLCFVQRLFHEAHRLF